MEILIYITVFIFAVLIYIQLEHSKDFEINKDELYFNNLPASFDRLKIAHLSDLHVSKYGKREDKIKETLKQEKPDIIFITGDFVNDSKGVKPCLNTMEGIEAPLGVWAVWGNNDNDLTDDKLKEGLEKLGIKILKNTGEKVTVKDDHIWITGVDDPHKEKDDLKKALEGIDKKSFKILLAHSPQIIVKAEKEDIDMIFSGHTHGGQVRFPFLGAIYSHTKGALKYSMGKFRINKTQMFVSRGMGMSILPIRFLCPAEMTFFTMKKI